MIKCSSCKKKFAWKAIGWTGGKEEFCSMACLPEGELDEPFAMHYYSLFESYRRFEELPIITSLTHQHETLVEVDYLLTQYEEYLLGDIEGSYYKLSIRDLLGLVFKVRDNIEKYFTIKENFYLDIGLFVGWEAISTELSELEAIDLQSYLQQHLDSLEDKPTILYNQDLDAVTESQNIIYFNYEESFVDAGIHPAIEQLHDIGSTYLKPFRPENYDSLFTYTELAKCPICGIMEPWEDFNLMKTENILACWSCQ